jgi:serine/threonine protein kinase
MTEIIDDISLIQYIDSGCFAETYLSKKEGSNILYATKKIDLKYIADEPFLKKYIENEIVILNEIQHPNIVKLFDVKMREDYIYLIMEYCNGGSLLKALNDYIEKMENLSLKILSGF